MYSATKVSYSSVISHNGSNVVTGLSPRAVASVTAVPPGPARTARIAREFDRHYREGVRCLDAMYIALSESYVCLFGICDVARVADRSL